MHIGESSATALPSTEARTAPSLARLAAKVMVDKTISPADFIHSDAQKARSALAVNESGKYTLPALVSPDDVLHSFIGKSHSTPTDAARRLKQSHTVSDSPSYTAIKAELKERRKTAASHISISADEVKQLLRPLASADKRKTVKPSKTWRTMFGVSEKKPDRPKATPAPRYKYAFTSPEALSKAAFGEQEPLQAYKTLLGRIGALTYEHGSRKDYEVGQSLQALARTEPPADPLECALALRSAISDLDQCVTYIDAIDELRKGLPSDIQTHRMFVGMHDYSKVNATFINYSRRLAKHGLGGPYPFTLDRSQPFTDDPRVKQRMAAADST